MLFSLFFLSLAFSPALSSRLIIANPSELIEKLGTAEIESKSIKFSKTIPDFSSHGRIYTLTDPESSCLPSSEKPPNDDFAILLMKQGKCSFGTMVKNVFENGWDTIVIFPQSDDSSEPFKRENLSSEGIDIPVLLITHKDGSTILNFIKDNPTNPVEMEVEISKKKTEVVELTMFLSIENLSILSQLKRYFSLFEEKVKIDPVFYTYPAKDASEEYISKNCVSKGKFCFSMDTDSDLDGRRLILDALYHQCVFKVSTSQNFLKVISSYEECFDTKPYVQFCSSTEVEKMKISNSTVMKCIYESFGTNAEEVRINPNNYYKNENFMLYVNNQKISGNSLNSFPTFFINGEKMEGRVNLDNLIEDICSHFIKEPEVCRNYFSISSENNEVLSWYWITLIIIGILLINIIIVLLCRKYVVKKIREKVEGDDFDIDSKINTVVSSYYNLREIETQKQSAA